MYPNKKQQELN
ncbi:hypothetical protein LWG87_20145 [Clostridioides difficile]|nr:hypothetical protein [Clostridioides difficile]